jgi:methyltransferase (TIGR00027 family)
LAASTACLLACIYARISLVPLLGVGLDAKVFRFAGADQQWYGVDLPGIIKERSQLLAQLGITAEYLTLVSADMRADNWIARLHEAGYDESRSTLFILEGVTMYLALDELRLLLQATRSANTNAASRVWLDHVKTALYDSELVEVQAFLKAMTRLGEPFISGFDDAAIVSAQLWEVHTTVSAAAFLSIAEPVHSMYLFSLLKPHAA